MASQCPWKTVLLYFSKEKNLLAKMYSLNVHSKRAGVTIDLLVLAVTALSMSTIRWCK